MIKSKKPTIKTFAELSKIQLYSILKLRLQVFCVEQNCPYQDIDDQDQQALHVFIQEDSAVIAYARIIKPKNNIFHIGRVVVDENSRKLGLATQIMNQCIEEIQKQKNTTIIISAQSYLQEFYKNLGFVNTGEYYLEDNIPHERMQLIS
ncbi:MAG: GNAT family N-acetyltransferase [Marinicellaceae bacterium]